MSLDSLLNLLWVAVSLASMAGFWLLERRRTERGRWVRVVSVLVLSLALFPSVSDTDDLFNFSLLQFPGSKHGGVGNAPNEESRDHASVHLARLLQTMEQFQISSFRTILPTLACVAILYSFRREPVSRTIARRPGRAPPAIRSLSLSIAG